jgi:hypothetical protein
MVLEYRDEIFGDVAPGEEDPGRTLPQMAIPSGLEEAKDFSLIPNIGHMSPLEGPQLGTSGLPKLELNSLPKEALDRSVSKLRMVVVFGVPIETLKDLIF